MSTVGNFRRTLMATLEAATGVHFVGGPRDSAQENREIGCVWLEGKTPLPVDGNMEQCLYGVRLIRNWRERQGETETGRNVETLEDDVELLQAALKAVLTTQGHDFFQIGGFAVNYDLQYVECSLTATQRNLGAAGG